MGESENQEEKEEEEGVERKPDNRRGERRRAELEDRVGLQLTPDPKIRFILWM